jgi:hypothetical protein
MTALHRSRVLRVLQVLWLGLSISSLFAALLAFKGVQVSEVPGNLTFFMLVLCLPASVLAYPVMFVVLDAMSAQGVFPYNSRFALCAVWSLFFIFGLIQWFGVPALWSKLRPAA